jgi:VWFA-related protein
MAIARHSVRVSLLLVSVVTAAAGQPPADVSAQAPVFRVGTELVQLVVRASDRNGRPVEGLVEADFTVLQDGKPQAIRLFRFVPASSRGPVASAAGPSAADMPPVILLVDDHHMDPSNLAWVRDATRRALGGKSPLRTKGAILSTRPGVQDLALTTDRAELLRQLDALAPTTNGYRPLPDVLHAECAENLSANLLEAPFGAGTLAGLPDILAALARIPGQKRLILISDCVITPACLETHWTFHERLRRLSDLATRSAVTIDGLYTRPMSAGAWTAQHRAAPFDTTRVLTSSPAPDNTVHDAMRRLAEDTGGEAWRSNEPGVLVSRALDADYGHYLIGYEPPSGTFAGDRPRYRSVEVRVARKGVTVRTRSGFFGVTDEQLQAMTQ